MEVQPKVLDALRLLVEARGRLLTKDELLAGLWPDSVVGEESLTQAVRKLRAVLGDDPREPRYLETVMKRGYRWVAPVEVVADEPEHPPPSPLAPENPHAHLAAPDLPAVRRPAVARLALAAAALAGLSLLAFQAHRRLTRDAEPFALERATPRRLTTTGERELHGALAPDGRSYVYTANRDGQFDLFLADLSGGGPIPLTRTPEDEVFPQVSPDGTKILFGREHPTLGGAALWIAGALGGGERMLVAQGTEGAFSPEGDAIAYSRRDPDGQWALVRRELASGAEQVLHRSRRRIAAPAWQPNPRWIAFSDGGAVRAVTADGSTLRTICERSRFVERLAWDPSGRSVVGDAHFAGEDRRLWRLAFDGSFVRPIVASTGDTCCPSLSLDGVRLLYTTENKQRQLWQAPAGGGPPRLLPVPNTVEGLDVSPDGTRVAFTDWEAHPGTTSLGLLSLSSGTVRWLGEGLAPGFSPDGGALAFLGASEADEGLWRLDLASGERRRLVRGTGPPGFRPENLDRRPAWSPDGRKIAFADVGGPPALVEVDGRDGGARRLAEGRFGPAAWSPDGSALAACGTSPAGTGLHFVDAVRGGASLVGEVCSYRAAPVWGADGTVVLLTDERREPRLLPVDRTGRALAPPLLLRRPVDPAFWGVFDARPDGRGGWVFLMERYEGDLHLATATR